MIELHKVSNVEVARLVNAEAQSFRLTNRRNKLLGMWAAARMELSSDKAEEYARVVAAAGISPGGDLALISKVRQDMAACGVELGADAIAAELHQAANRAARELLPEPPLRPAA